MPDPEHPVVPLLAKAGGDSALLEARAVLSPLPLDCPPAKAEVRVGKIFRLAESDPPTSQDFMSYYVLYPNRQWKKHELCESHGLSVQLSAEAALSQLKRINARLKAAKLKLIVVADIDTHAGPIAQTFKYPDHHTWWPSFGFNFQSAFSAHENSTP